MEFNSKICTTRSQSERLLALGLKKETADMVYKPHSHYPDEVINYCEPTPMVEPLRKYIIADDIDFRYYIPAWSLHRLIDMMPTVITHDDYILILGVNATCVYYANDEYSETFRAFEGDLYDCGVKCIEWLIKEGYFNKEYLK